MRIPRNKVASSKIDEQDEREKKREHHNEDKPPRNAHMQLGRGAEVKEKPGGSEEVL